MLGTGSGAGSATNPLANHEAVEGHRATDVGGSEFAFPVHALVKDDFDGERHAAVSGHVGEDPGGVIESGPGASDAQEQTCQGHEIWQ